MKISPQSTLHAPQTSDIAPQIEGTANLFTISDALLSSLLLNNLRRLFLSCSYHRFTRGASTKKEEKLEVESRVA